MPGTVSPVSDISGPAIPLTINTATALRDLPRGLDAFLLIAARSWCGRSGGSGDLRSGMAGLFSELRDRVDAALAGVAHVTEHVGSTAVPGLDAKPVIDLDVVVPGDAAVGPAIETLAAAGWRHQGDLGITGREAFAPPADAVYHHLYVVVAGSGRIVITSTCVISCVRIPVRQPGTAS